MFSSFSDVNLRKLASTHGDIRVYDVVDGATPKPTEKAKSAKIKKKSK